MLENISKISDDADSNQPESDKDLTPLLQKKSTKPSQYLTSILSKKE